MRKQVISEENVGRTYLQKNRKTGLKTLVTTAASMITDMKGHRMRPIIKAETEKTARKGHNCKFLLMESFMKGLRCHSYN